MMNSKQKKRILLCVPNVGRRPINTHRLFTLGLLYLRNACVQAHWDCVLLDAYFDNLSRTETIERIKKSGRFDVIGFTLNDDAMLNESEAICTGLKTDAVIIAGGVYATRMADSILSKSETFSHIFKGEAEETLKQFLFNFASSIHCITGIVSRYTVANAARISKRIAANLDDLGGWHYRDIPQKIAAGEYSLVTSRGCTARCNYCVIGPHWSRYGLWRGHSAEWIFDKFVELQDAAATCINIVDDQFVGSEESIQRAYRLAALLIQNNIFIPFVIMVRAETVNNEPGVFRALAQAGLQTVFIGLESGDNEVLQLMNKETSAEEGCQAVATLSEMGIAVSSGTIIFHPWATLKTLKTDISYFRKLIKQHDNFDFYGLNEMDLLNGTPVSKMFHADTLSWRTDWQCQELEADIIYQNWLKVQVRFLFPFLEQLNETQEKDIWRDCCVWMLDAVEYLVNALEAGDINSAFFRISLEMDLLSLRVNTRDSDNVLALKQQTDYSQSVIERCFK